MNTAGNRTCIITSRLSDLSHRGVYTHIKAGKHVMFEKQQFPASFFTKGHGLYKKIFHHSLQHTCTYLRKILVFFLRSPFTYDVLSYLRNNSFLGNLFMSYLFIFLIPTFAPPLTFTGLRKQHA